MPFWVTALVAFVLAAGTAAGGRRIVRTVSSRFYRGGLLDGARGAERLGDRDPRRGAARRAGEHLDGRRLGHDRGGGRPPAPSRPLAYVRTVVSAWVITRAGVRRCSVPA